MLELIYQTKLIAFKNKPKYAIINTIDDFKIQLTTVKMEP